MNYCQAVGGKLVVIILFLIMFHNLLCPKFVSAGDGQSVSIVCNKISLNECFKQIDMPIQIDNCYMSKTVDFQIECKDALDCINRTINASMLENYTLQLDRSKKSAAILSIGKCQNNINVAANSAENHASENHKQMGSFDDSKNNQKSSFAPEETLEKLRSTKSVDPDEPLSLLGGGTVTRRSIEDLQSKYEVLPIDPSQAIVLPGGKTVPRETINNVATKEIQNKLPSESIMLPSGKVIPRKGIDALQKK
ncbi:hypothetical protein [Desulfovibrio sp. TomC]|uniref:hypothetical protein n=1 Tax=Desulfovibrio sp. TomC TaxID=1562888 RepID=UPI0012E15845|nr:hypothetical protein [Desulfovibrio sp. TomC]